MLVSLQLIAGLPSFGAGRGGMMVGLESQPGEGMGWQHGSTRSSRLIRFQGRQCAVLSICASSLLAQRWCGLNSSGRGLFGFVCREARGNTAHLGDAKNPLS